MARPLDLFLSLLRRPVQPTNVMGTPGTAIRGGFVERGEKDPKLENRDERYRVYSEILANTSIVAAGVRQFVNLIAKSDWAFKPGPGDPDGVFAERVEKALTEDPSTPWHRVVRRAAMYRFYGFSLQEWTAKRSDEGWLTFKDVAPRAQLTIDKWDVDVEGSVVGVIQRSPQTLHDMYLPRGKLLYLVDDTLNDSPEGLGLFRHLVSPAQRLRRYEQLEGFGFETDLRGIPIGRGPFQRLGKDVASGALSEAQRQALEDPLRKFVKAHLKTPDLGLLLDSMTYESKDEAGRASNARQWDLDLLKGSSTSFAENAAAIERVNRELARILGVEQLLLGSDSTGSFAMSRDKTSSFFLMVDGALQEIREAVADDLVDRLWQLNGWPEDAKPKLGTEAVRFKDAEQVAKTLRDMAAAGAILDPDDPVIDEVRDLMGVSQPGDAGVMSAVQDAALNQGPQPAAPSDGGEEPGDEA